MTKEKKTPNNMTRSVHLKPIMSKKLNMGNPMKPLIGNGSGNPYGFARSI